MAPAVAKRCSICRNAMQPITKASRTGELANVIAHFCPYCDRRKCECGALLRLGTEQTCPQCFKPTCPQR